MMKIFVDLTMINGDSVKKEFKILYHIWNKTGMTYGAVFQGRNSIASVLNEH